MEQEVKIKYTAEDDTKEVTETMAMRIKNMRAEERASGDLALERFLKGGLGEAGLRMAGLGVAGVAIDQGAKALEQMAEKANELGHELREDKINAADVTLELMKTVPVIGEAARAGEALNELFTGQKEAIKGINEEAKLTLEIASAQVAYAKEYKEILEKMHEEGRKEEQRLAIAAAKTPEEKARLQAEMGSEDRKASEKKETDAALTAVRESSNKEIEERRKQLEKDRAELEAMSDPHAGLRSAGGSFGNIAADFMSPSDQQKADARRAVDDEARQITDLEAKRDADIQAIKDTAAKNAQTADATAAQNEKNATDKTAEQSALDFQAQCDEESRIAQEAGAKLAETQAQQLKDKLDAESQATKLELEAYAKREEALGDHLAAQTARIHAEYDERIRLATNAALKQALIDDEAAALALAKKRDDDRQSKPEAEAAHLRMGVAAEHVSSDFSGLASLARYGDELTPEAKAADQTAKNTAGLSEGLTSIVTAIGELARGIASAPGGLQIRLSS